MSNSPLPSKINYPTLSDPNAGFSIGSDSAGMSIKRNIGSTPTPSGNSIGEFHSLSCENSYILDIPSNIVKISHSEQDVEKLAKRLEWGPNETIISNTDNPCPINRAGASFVLQPEYIYKVETWIDLYPRPYQNVRPPNASIYFRIGDANTRQNLGYQSHGSMAAVNMLNEIIMHTSSSIYLKVEKEVKDISIFYYTFISDDSSDKVGWQVQNGKIMIGTVAQIPQTT